jgi:hypothetical protein
MGEWCESQWCQSQLLLRLQPVADSSPNTLACEYPYEFMKRILDRDGAVTRWICYLRNGFASSNLRPEFESTYDLRDLHMESLQLVILALKHWLS